MEYCLDKKRLCDEALEFVRKRIDGARHLREYCTMPAVVADHAKKVAVKAVLETGMLNPDWSFSLPAAEDVVTYYDTAYKNFLEPILIRMDGCGKSRETYYTWDNCRLDVYGNGDVRVREPQKNGSVSSEWFCHVDGYKEPFKAALRYIDRPF